MTTDQALEILRTIDEMYPKFKLTKRKAQILIPNLKHMDYTGVMKNLSDHIIHVPYPPLISEIAAYPKEADTSLLEIAKWQEEAKQVTPEVKERFREQLEKLFREKGGK